MNRNHNFSSSYGQNYNSGNGYQGYQPRGRGRGGPAPRSYRGRGQGGYQPRGGNSRGAGNQYNQGYQSRDSQANNRQNWSRTPAVEKQSDFGQETSADDFVEQHHFAYEYDEETVQEQQDSSAYEHVPEYRQSGEQGDAYGNADNYTDNSATGYGDDCTADYQGYADNSTTDYQNTTSEEYANSNPVDDSVKQSTEENQDNKNKGAAVKKEETGKDDQQNEDSGSESDEDTSYCKYCKKPFQTIGAYKAHIRGMQHTQLYMEAKAKKKGETGSNPQSESTATPSVSGTGVESKPQVAGPSEQDKKDTGGTAEEQQEEEDSDSEEEDTGFCKYCKLTFTSAKAFHTHTRGIQHTTLVMEAKAKKGDVRFKKEVVAPEVLEVNIPKPREPVVESRREGYEIEDNWMNLDGDVIDYIKNKKNVQNKDLLPEEIGKKTGEDYACPLCEIYCTGPAAFKSHLEGKAHKNKMQQAEQGVLVRKNKQRNVSVAVPSHGRPSKMSLLMEGNKNPMLGLDYIVEYQKPDFKQLARYVCNLCESKMDEYAIIPHVVGAKHRLTYLKVANFALYEHVTKYTSKKKKSELNAMIEEFAQDIENDEGRRDVKVKIEVGEEDDKAELEESMMKASRALKEKVSELEHRAENMEEPAVKRGRYDDRKRDFHGRDDDRWGGRGDRYPPPWDRSREPPRGDWDRGGWGDRPGRDWPRDREWDRDRRDPYYPHRHPEYHHMDERRLYAERRYLDSQMHDRYRLDDPYQERRRMDDVLARRDSLDAIERERIARVEQRRREMEETDPDVLRLRRFTKMEDKASASPAATDSPRTDDASYRPSMEELVARRRQNREFVDRFQDRPKVDDTLLPRASSSTASDTRQIARSTEETLAQKVMATKSVQEEVARNPEVNVSDLLSKLSSSMIASENEAAMALQISSALTQALLTYRLQSAPKGLTNLMESMHPSTDTPQDTSIPGLDSGSASSATTSVPSFLRSPAPGTSEGQYAAAQTGSESYLQQTGYQNLYQAPAAQTGDQSAYSQQTGLQTYYPTSAGQTGLSTSYAVPASSQGYASQAQSSSQNTYQSPYVQSAPQVPSQSSANGSYASSLPQSAPQVTYQSSPMQTSVQSSMYQPASSQSTAGTTSISDLLNTDQPQKQILESIRKQTELLKKKIQKATQQPKSGAATRPVQSPQGQSVDYSQPGVATSSQYRTPQSPQMVQPPALAPTQPPVSYHRQPRPPRR